MKAAVLVKHGNASTAFEIREVDDIKANPEQVLVETEAFGLNFADVMARNGLYREAPPLPAVLGYDFVGRVIQAPKDFQHLMGRRVAGLCRFGGYAKLIATHPLAVAEVPEDMNAAEATALGTQYATAYHAACQITQLHEGDKVLIHAAAGGVGTALIQLAKWKKCEISGTVGSDEKVAHIKSLGVHHAINYRKSDYAQEIKKILGETRLDLTFNPIAGSTFKKDLKLVGSGGRLVLFGAAERSGMKGLLPTYRFLFKMGLIMPILLMAKSRSILGVNMLKIADHRPEMIGKALAELVELHGKGIIKPHIGGVFNIKDIAIAHQQLEERKTQGKLAVKW
ncbi:MAG: zinc-binding dehydrogenase [Flavobacteriales bacterium]|nr:zinc-binding dehydrogenase [Flavobacteriales bacterium]